MTTWEPLVDGSRYLAFARRVMGRDTEFLSTVRRFTEQGNRLRRKYALPLVKPSPLRRVEPLVRRVPLHERRAESAELVLASAVPSWWSQEAEGQVRPSELIERPSSEPRRREPVRAADMRTAVQRARASAEAQRQVSPEPATASAGRRARRELPTGQARSVRRRALLVEEPDRQQAWAPEQRQSTVAGPSPVVEEPEAPRQRGGVPAEPEELAEGVPVVEEPAEVASEGSRTRRTEAQPSSEPAAHPTRESSPAPAARPERAAVRGEEALPVSVEDAEDILPEAMEAQVEEVEEHSEASSEPASQEGEGGSITRIARRRAALDRAGPELSRDTAIPAPVELEESRAEQGHEAAVEPETYTRLGTTSYEGNLRREARAPSVSSEAIEGQRSVPERAERSSEEIQLPAPLEEPEVAEEADGPEQPGGPRVVRAADELSDEDGAVQEERVPPEAPVVRGDALGVPREAEDSRVSGSHPTLREERPSEAETDRAPSADVVHRAPTAAPPPAPDDHIVREEEPFEGIGHAEEASSSPHARTRFPESGEGEMAAPEEPSLDAEGPGLQDVPLEEALFGASGVLRRARRSSPEEAGETETSFVLPSISFRPPEARERVSSDQVRRADDTQAPAEATAEVGSGEAEAPDLEEEEREQVDVDQLADEVYRRLRDRLRVERERYGRRGRW